jgi:hypothetical protein
MTTFIPPRRQFRDSFGGPGSYWLWPSSSITECSGIGEDIVETARLETLLELSDELA